MRRLAVGLLLAVAVLTGCADNSLAHQQDVINNSTNGQPGSWQCIQHFGDQSQCDSDDNG